jgi:hypothetical protein
MNLQLKIQLKHISKPPVWRKVEVPQNITFAELHLVIQASFGWGNYHLYQFSPSGWGSHPCIEEPHEESDGLDASEILVGSYLTAIGQKFVYIYDFGGSWEHLITVEKIVEAQSETKVTVLGGKGTCPPEDCGGLWGYENLKVVLADKKHPEHKEMKEWLGMGARDVWDDNYFDKDYAQEMVNSIIA